MSPHATPQPQPQLQPQPQPQPLPVEDELRIAQAALHITRTELRAAREDLLRTTARLAVLEEARRIPPFWFDFIQPVARTVATDNGEAVTDWVLAFGRTVAKPCLSEVQANVVVRKVKRWMAEMMQIDCSRV